MNIEKELIEEEGLSLSCYKDTKNNWTIGVGHLLRSPCDDITLEEAGRLLRYDIGIAQNELREKIPVYAELDQVRQFCLISMCFNLGITKLLKFKKMLLALENKNYELASVEMLDSLWARQVNKRASKLAHLMRSGSTN